VIAELLADRNDRKTRLTTKRATYVSALLDPVSFRVTKDTTDDEIKEMIRKLNDIEIFIFKLGVGIMSCEEYRRAIKEHAEYWRKVVRGKRRSVRMRGMIGSSGSICRLGSCGVSSFTSRMW
jgi:hypothetical protein